VAVAFACTAGPGAADCTPAAPLAEGANTLTATIENPGGESSAPAQVHFTVDTQPPTISITAPTDGSATAEPRPAIVLAWADAGTAVDPASLVLVLDGAPLAAGCTSGPAGAQCTPTADLADGAHTLEATVADVTGKPSLPAQAGFTVDSSDTEPPAILLTAPAPGTVTAAAEVRFTGSLSEPAVLTLDGTPVAVAGDLTFDHGPVPLAEGPQRFVLEATDAVGHTSVLEIPVLRDTAATQNGIFPAIRRHIPPASGIIILIQSSIRRIEPLQDLHIMRL
jgi:hypothetical protein